MGNLAIKHCIKNCSFRFRDVRKEQLFVWPVTERSSFRLFCTWSCSFQYRVTEKSIFSCLRKDDLFVNTRILPFHYKKFEKIVFSCLRKENLSITRKYNLFGIKTIFSCLRKDDLFVNTRILSFRYKKFEKIVFSCLRKENLSITRKYNLFCIK